MSDASKKKFTEDEVGRLLQLAIKRQEEVKDTHASLDHGLTLEEIERIAREVGIDPMHLNYALAHLDDPTDEAPGFYFWGSPQILEFGAEVDGRLTEETMVDMLAAIRETFPKSRGNFEKLKNSFSWNNSTITIEAQPLGEKTLLNLKEKMDGPIVGAHLWWILSLLLGLMIYVGTDTTLFTLSITAGITGLLYAIGWYVNRTISEKKEQKIRGLLSRLREISVVHNQPATWSYADSATNTSPTSKLDLEASKGYVADPPGKEAVKKTKSS